MWIERVIARAFGPLHDETLHLAEGMNVIGGILPRTGYKNFPSARTSPPSSFSSTTKSPRESEIVSNAFDDVENVLAAAKDQGLDMARLEQDSASDEVNATLKEDIQLASAVGITGTPGYVIGKDVIPGAVGIAALKRQIDTSRGVGGH